MGYCGGPQTSDDDGDVTYDTVCDGDGNTEVVKVTFDTAVTSHEEILREFWHVSGRGALKKKSRGRKL